MKDYTVILISGLIGLLPSILTYFIGRRKSDADVAALITEATEGVVKTLLEEQKRQRERISELEHEVAEMRQFKHKLEQVGEFVLSHPGEGIPKHEMAKFFMSNG